MPHSQPRTSANLARGPRPTIVTLRDWCFKRASASLPLDVAAGPSTDQPVLRASNGPYRRDCLSHGGWVLEDRQVQASCMGAHIIPFRFYLMNGVSESSGTGELIWLPSCYWTMSRLESMSATSG